MNRPPFRNPSAVFAVWAGAVAACVAAAIAANTALSIYVEHARAKDPRTYLNDAQRLIDRNDMRGAAERINQAIAKAPQNPESYRLAGLLEFRQKHFQEAFDAFRKAIDLGSRDEDMRIKAMNALMQMGRYQDAIQFGKSCMDQGYRYPTFPRYLAETYRALNRPDDAIPYYLKALEGYPNDLFLIEHLAQAYRDTGKANEAEAMEKRIAETQTPQEQPPSSKPKP